MLIKCIVSIFDYFSILFRRRTGIRTGNLETFDIYSVDVLDDLHPNGCQDMGSNAF